MFKVGLKLVLFFFTVLPFIAPLTAGDLLLHWQFDASEGEFEEDVAGNQYRARFLRGDHNLPLPERVPGGVHGEETGAARLIENASIASFKSLPLPESWTLSFWIKDQRSEQDRPQRLSPADIVSVERKLLALDRPWYFRADPAAGGHERNWHLGEHEGWEEIQVPAFWSNTHVGGNYYGYGWYKTSFFVPGEAAPMEHELHFGGVDEQAWVYVNGRLVGEQSTESTGKTVGDIWDKPFSVTVTPDVLRPGEDNLLVVRSHASGGEAGIFRPVSFRLPRQYRGTLALEELNGERTSPGKWEHVALTVDPGQARFYINGALAAVTSQPLWEHRETLVQIIFSQRGDGEFVGLLDDVRVYRTGLDEQQIARLSGAIYHPESGWLTQYDEDLQRLIHAGAFSRDRTEYMIGLGAPDKHQLIRTSKISDDARERVDALWALGVLGGDDAVERLIAVLADEDDEMVKTANQALLRRHEEDEFISSLREQGDPAAVTLLKQLLLQAGEEEIQFAALSALSKLDLEAARQALATAVAEGSWLVRRHAARALHEQGVATDTALVEELLGWPMWRYDTVRSGEWPGELAEELHLQWTRELPAPKRAWRPQRDDRRKLDFDVSFSPVAVGDLLFVPSSSTDSVTAYRLSDGREVWRFFADGPVRLAPAFADGRLFFTADDGRLYCLDAADGSLLWKFRGGPSDQRLLGNERIINFWAARGAPLVADGIVYFTAGLWPLHGVFIYALDATDGSVVWVNDTTGSDYVRIPRGSVYGGLAPQGYLALTRSFPERARDRRGRPLEGDYLIVSGGRAGPAFFCRKTGDIVADLFDVTALLRDKQAGGFAVHGVGGLGMGKIESPMLRDRLDNLSEPPDGEVFYKLAVGDCMVVVTESGTLYCFGPERVEPEHYQFRPASLSPAAEPWPDVVRELLDRHGDDDGYGLVLGAGSGGLIRELLRQSSMHLVVVESDADRVQSLREELVRTGTYGHRVAVTEAEPATFSVQPYLFSLMVSEDASAANIVAEAPVLSHLLDRLRPYNGVAWLGAPADTLSALTEAAESAEVDQVSIDRHSGHLLATRGGPLTGAGQWTHQYHDPANTLLSQDRLARLPLGVLWFGGPNNHNILGKHSRGPRPQVAAGRQVFLGVDTLAARCVYTGRELWERDFPGLGSLFDTTANLPGTSYIGSPVVTLADNVYLRFKGKIHRLDAATGDTLDVFILPERRQDQPDDDDFDWGHISVQGDYLVTTRELYMFEGQRPGHPSSYSATASRRLMVMDRRTGTILWEREAEQGFRHNGVISSGEVLFIVDGLPESQLALLARRGLEPEAQPRLYALELADGSERWSTDDRVFGTFLIYCADRDILVEGGSHDIRHQHVHPDEEPRRTIARRGADGTVIWANRSFPLPAAVRGEMLISASRFHRRAVSLLTGETWPRINPHTGEENAWTFSKSKNCDSLNASRSLLLFRTTYAGFFDLDYDSGIGFFSGFRSGCTANMIAADGLVNALDYTRFCNCAYPHQTSLALVHMPDDPNIEFWTTGAGTSPDPAGHGVNFGAPGRRVDAAGSGRVWFPRDGSRTRHPSVIKDHGESLAWVLASVQEVTGDDAIIVNEVNEGTYKIRLHFAELQPDVQPGQRVFDISVNGTEVVSGMDVVAAAAGPFRGVVKEFIVDIGRRASIQLRSTEESAFVPIINGIELISLK